MLSNAIFLFSKDSISSADFKTAESSLTKFHLGFSKLYGEQNLVYNTHLLTHIPECVRNFGHLWAFSNFSFEDFNGVLKSYVSGTTDVLQQIVSKYLLTLEMNRLKTPFWEAICGTKKVKRFDVLGDVTLFGNGEKPSISLKNYITSARPDMPDIDDLKCYKSCKYLCETFTIFKKNVKCLDSVFKTKDNNYGNIIHITKIDGNVYVLAQMFKSEKSFLADHLIEVKLEDRLVLISITNIAEKCIWIQTKRHSIISSFPNRVEHY